jgi:prepilin-type N-terminal cleavage/methylation domain-containing protein
MKSFSLFIDLGNECFAHTKLCTTFNKNGMMRFFIMLRRNNKGFTLIEVLLAVSLLGIALIPIVQAMPNIFRVNREMIIENKMSFYAQDQLEMAKSGVIASFDTNRNQSSQSISGDTNYKYNVIDNLGTSIDADATSKEFKIITIQMWYGGSGSTYAGASNKIELETKISKRPS